MATPQEIRPAYQVQRTIYDSQIVPGINSLTSQVSNGATWQQIQSQYNSIYSLTGQVSTSLSSLKKQAIEADPYDPGLVQAIEDLDAKIFAAQQELNLLRNLAEANTAKKEQSEPLPATSSGVTVRDDAAGASNGARTQNPQPAPEYITVDGELVAVPAVDQTGRSNANVPPLSNNADLGAQDGSTSTVGGNSPTRTAQQVQNSQTGGTGGIAAVAAGDDAVSQDRQSSTGIATGSSGPPPIAPEFLAPIISTPNKLAGLSSMTYTISIYLMNTQEYAQLLTSQKKVIAPTQPLIIQSGGIPVGRRDSNFDVDFYIDDLWIESLIGTQSGTRAHNATQLKMTIIEPNGITLLNRLKNAVKQHSQITGVEVNELSQNFLLVIRFYGYDIDGKLISGSQLGISEAQSDPSAVVEKFFPFQITDIRWQISNKAVEYQLAGITPATGVPFSQMYATIPFNMEIAAADVQTLLNGSAIVSSITGLQTDENQSEAETRRLAANAPKASTINTKNYSQGLCEALNLYQQELKNQGGIEIPNQYEIILEDVTGLKDAKIAKPGTQTKNDAPMTVTENAANKYLSSKTSYDVNTKKYSITAGTQIVQLIDLIMRTSSYITSQQNIIFDEKTGQIRAQGNVATVQWYRIRSRAVPLGYDKKKRDLSYKITYIISRYQINDPKSAYFPVAAYRGTHKLYNYWFTGQNTEVLDFKIDVNANFYMTIGNDGLEPNFSSGRYFEKRAFQARPNESSQGGTGETTMPAANLADRLYSFADVANNELTILGDPDWLQQATIFYNREINLASTMPDGSVNVDASEVLYELRFNPPTDYDLTTGLMPIKNFNYALSQVTKETNIPQESIVWAAHTVHSNFRQGKFTQKLLGNIRNFNGNITATGTVVASAANPDANSSATNQTQDANVNSSADAVRQPGSTAPVESVDVNNSFAENQAASDIIAGVGNTINLSEVPPKPGSTVVDDDAADPVVVYGP